MLSILRQNGKIICANLTEYSFNSKKCIYLFVYLFRLCPIFQVSNVTGKNIDLLKSFFNLLNPRMENFSNDPAEFQIDDIYSVPGKINFSKITRIFF